MKNHQININKVFTSGGGDTPSYYQQINQLKQKGDNILSKVLLVNCCSYVDLYRWGGGQAIYLKLEIGRAHV